MLDIGHPFFDYLQFKYCVNCEKGFYNIQLIGKNEVRILIIMQNANTNERKIKWD
jgi:hypothetical protein